MATQTPEKTNGAPAIQKSAVAARPLGRFALDPFWGFDAMREMIESMFGLAGLPDWRGVMEPAVNLYETDGAYTLECAVPGYSKDDVTVEVRGDQVILSGSYEHEKTDEKKHFTRKEIRQASFTRMIALPQEVDPDQVSAKLENGMLKVKLHPTKAIKSKTIPVTA
jgi:HSP20 family protein